MAAFSKERPESLNDTVTHAKVIAIKSIEAKQLNQLEGQLTEAIGILKDVVETVRELEPEAIGAIKAEVIKIFE